MNEFICETCSDRVGCGVWLTYDEMLKHKDFNKDHKIVDINKEALSEEVEEK